MKYTFTLLITAAIMLQTSLSSPALAAGHPEDIKLDTAMTAQEIAAGVFTPEVMLKMGRLGSPIISPDGKQLLYTLTYYNVQDNKGYTSLWVMPLNDPKKAAQITDNASGAGSPSWNKADGGKSIFFLSRKSESKQLWKINADGSGLEQLSDIEGGIEGYGITNKTDKIWYAASVKIDKVASSELYSDVAQSKALIYDDLMERHWDHWNDGTYSHIFVADLDLTKGKEAVRNAKDIMPGEPWDAPLAPYHDMHEISWNNAGTALAYTCKKLTGREYAVSTDSDIYLYDLQTGKTTNLSPDDAGYDKYPVFSPDDKLIAWQSMERPGNESDIDRLIVKDLTDDTRERTVLKYENSLDQLKFSPDGKYLYFITPTQATHQIGRYQLSDGKIEILTVGSHDYVSYDIAHDAKGKAFMVGARTTISSAPEFFVVRREIKNDQQITFVNDPIYKRVGMGEVRKRWVETTDGKEMLTWVILPPGFDESKKYPVLLYCQGGPQSVVSQRWSYRWNFQLMAAQGYVVVAPNRRGLPSFGQEWLDQISGDYSGQNIRDYLAAIDDVAKEPWADENRMGCVGASYGGYSTFYLAGHHENRFKAMIAHCGMFNLESFYGETEELFFVNNDLGGPYWEKNNATAQRSYANSPHKAVNNWTAPILIIAGANDFRIPYTQSLQAFTAARLHGIPARLVYFEDEAHQVFKPQNSLVWNREFFGWLQKYLQTGE